MFNFFLESSSKDKVVHNNRITIILYFFYIAVFIIISRFFYLQIIRGDFFYQKSLGNTEREYKILAPRGLIFDSKNRIVAENRTAFVLSFIAGFVPKKKEVREPLFKKLTEILNLEKDFLEKKFLSNRKNYKPILVKESLSEEELIYLNEYKNIYPFLSIVEYSGRFYPYQESLSSVLGYIGAISQKDYNKLKDQGYTQDSIIGQAGIEKQYDTILKGKDGRIVRVVDVVGRVIRDLPEKNITPVTGKNLVLSIDADLQDLIYQSLKGYKGAVIVSKVDTGEIISFVSFPSYNANTFLYTDDKNIAFSTLTRDSRKPFLNRPIQGQYAPGSTFKLVVALAALEDNKLDPKKVEDTRIGYFRLGKQIFRELGFKPEADLATAIEKSNNVYFYRLAYALGYSSILEYSTRLGLRDKTHIDLPNELYNFTPTPEWKEKRFKEIWVEGDTINISIGQGYLLLTPMGIHNIISTIAAGKLMTPKIVWEIQNPYTGTTESKMDATLATEFKPKPSTLSALREGLERVAYTGTATYHKYLSKVPIAGKTGTAQNSTGSDHAVFISYGPTDKPVSERYAITVLVESSGFGARVVPVSSIIYNYLAGVQTKQEAITMLKRILPTTIKTKQIKGKD